LALVASTRGKVYAIGGRDPGDTLLARVDEYDLAMKIWVPRANMPAARLLAGAAEVNGKIYAIGWSSYIFGVAGTVEEYDSSTDSWRNRSPAPVPTEKLGWAGTRDGKLYMLGYGNATWDTDLLEFDPAKDAWRSVGRLPIPATSTALEAVMAGNGRAYILTYSGDYGGQTSIVEFDPVTRIGRSFLTSPRLPLSGALAVAEGKVYSIGGFDGGKLADALREAALP
jgi:hypothetical protein